MFQRLSSFGLILIMFLSLSTLVLAQELGATLSGTVTDPTGAVVPNASVLIHNNDTKADRSLTTGSNGSFAATNLQAGRYNVTVKSSGFQTYLAENVVLNVGEKRSLNVELQTGHLTETIEVTATNAPVQTASAEESQTITGTQVRDLALNNRNFEQLVVLAPGVASQLGDEPGFGLQNNATISVNGARADANNWTVDGADVNDAGSNGTLLNVPSIDAIQEFTLKRSSYDAGYGHSGGGQVLVATKSGTSQFHGDLYEFVRNDAFNANDFLDNEVGNSRPIERYNDFGGTFGGPIYIPGKYNTDKSKTFFFVSEEWRKASMPDPGTFTVPTAAELNGVFTSPIPVAPAGCVSSSGGTYTIAPSCISKNAAAYVKAIYDANPANNPAGNEVIANASQLNNFRQDIIKIDQQVTDKIHAYARFMQDSTPQNAPYGVAWENGNNLPGVAPTTINAPGRNWVGNLIWTLSPKIVNETEYADSWGGINMGLSGTWNSPAFLSTLTNNTAYQDPYGRAPLTEIAGGGITGTMGSYAPYFERTIDHSVFDNLSISEGNHEIRMGFSLQMMAKFENATSGWAQFNFTGTNGNPAFANFLLGQADSYSQPDRDMIPHLHYHNIEAYIQDDWKITRRLTLNLGVRYSYFPSPADSNNILNNFDPAAYNPALAPAIDPATGNFVSGSPATYANGIIFPTGAACTAAQAISNTASCSPYGSLVNPNSNNNFAPRVGLAWDPFGQGKTAIRAGWGLFYDRTLNGQWEYNAFYNPPLVQTTTVNNNANSSLNLFDNPSGGAAGGSSAPNEGWGTGTPTEKIPSYQNWNFSVQQEILKDTELGVAYVGSKGTHLIGDVDLNQPTLAAREADPTANVNAIAPYLGYGFIRSTDPVFSSNYNSLQVTLNRRVSRGLNIGVAYTWSKSLTNSPQSRGLAPEDTYDLAMNYGPSTLNTPQMLMVNYVYDLPFFKSQQGFAGHVLGGWELSGITTFESGQSLTVIQTTDPFDTGNGGLGMTAPGSDIQIRPDVTGNLFGAGTKTDNQWFNPNAFTQATGHFGTSGVGTILGPGFENWDVSLFKNISFKERVKLQLRVEAFNVFNHTSPASWANGASGVDMNISDSTFGQITAFHDPRMLQLGAKLTF